MNALNSFKPVDPSLLFSRHDLRDPRLGELVKPAMPEANEKGAGVAILGYPDDEGIQINGGRTGAAQGPTEIRRALYRMTPHPRRPLLPLIDIGDLKLAGDLSVRHENAQRTVESLLLSGLNILSFGGGNDYAFPDGLALLRSCRDQRPLVINVDAHFDVRDTSRGLSSGTPFYRLLESGLEFDFLELGIQGQCNARAHWDYVESRGGRILSLEEYLESGLSLLELTTRTLGDWLLRSRPTFVAIDIDAFAWPYAMGSSAAWPLGLSPHQFWPVLQLLLRRLDVRVLGIYEVSPPLDPAGGTSKLAAQLAHTFLHEVR
ncbi:MAG: formimidoylglutamase [Bdellovibrionales bacterium]